MQKRAKLVRWRSRIFCAVYLVATFVVMLNFSITKIDGGHCFNRGSASAMSHQVAGELRLEARELDTRLVGRVYRRDLLDEQVQIQKPLSETLL